MHKLIEAAGRRRASLAAGVILTGGLVGGVLLAPAAAYAATATITITSATSNFGGINVQVSVTNGTDPLGTFSVAGAGSGCTGNLFGMPGSGSGVGHCNIQVGAGSYTLTASYDGASSSPDAVTVGNPTPPPGNAPVWSADSPSTSVNSQSYSYQFQASGSPAYGLSGGPGWLNIDPSTGAVSGSIPFGTTSFSYSVKAWNNYGTIWAGPFTVSFNRYYHNYHNDAFVNLHTQLSCTSPVNTGHRGTCTLWVTNSDYNYPWNPFGQYNNFGQNFASDVTAQIALPYQLKADFCGYGYGFFWNGCQIYGNTATKNLGNLYPGQTKSFTVTFTARSGFNLWGYNPGHSFYVKVVGSASSDHDNFFFFGQGTSYSVAYVKIRPYGEEKLKRRKGEQ
jgi:hypothetical protein